MRNPSAPAAFRLVPALILAGTLLAALLLVVAEFTTLYKVHTSASRVVVKSEGTGAHQSYALLPLTVVLLVLTVGVWRSASRAGLIAIGVIGVAALLIALLGDLPDAQRSGYIAIAGDHLVAAKATPSAGLYMETLGAVLAMMASVASVLLLRPPE
jgi:hypothetical protein